MAINFALFLSPEGIALAHRQTTGQWAFVGETRIDVDDLDAALAELRATAVDRGGKDFETLLVLPDDQILYTSLMAPTSDLELTLARIEEGLDGLTPYPVADLVYDYRPVEEDRVKLAVVAAETLDEAREFAKGHGFIAAGFAAMPPSERFPGLPVFLRPGEPDLGLPRDGLAFGNDKWRPEAEAGAEVVRDDPAPEAEAAKDAVATPKADPEPVDETAGALPDATADAGDDAPPADDGPDSADAPATGTETLDAGSDDVSRDTPEETAKDAGDDGFDLDGPNPVEDLFLSRAVTPLPDEDSDDASDASAAAAPAADTKLDPVAEPDPEPAVAPEPAQKKPPVASGDKPAPDASGDQTEPVAAKGNRKTPSLLKAEKKPARTNRAGAPRVGSARSGTDAPTAPPDADPTQPIPSFRARRGKAAAPDPAAPRSVSARNSRIGFGGDTGKKTEPNLHPDAGPAPSDTPAQGDGLAARLARVRDASKARPKTPAVTAPPASRSASLPVPPPVATRTGNDPLSAPPPTPSNSRAAAAAAAGSAARIGAGAVGAVSGLLATGRRKLTERKAAKPKAQTAPETPGTGADGVLTSGLLARKPVDNAGPSFRTGLILTVILLVLLAGIAIWSVLFLPNSPMARFFGADQDTALVDPLDAPTAPAAITAPPAMGERDIGGAIDDVVALAPVATQTAPVARPDVTPEPDPDTLAALEPLADPLADPGAAPEALAETADELLPDIDADLDLEPLPPLPQDNVPSLEETERIFAEDGIWARPPDRPDPGAFDNIDGVYIASIDPAVPGFDALALPEAATDFNEAFRRIPPPPPFGREFALSPDGIVAPTPEGVLTPEGAFVISGPPPVAAVQRPRDPEPIPDPETLPVIGIEDAILGTFRPAPRPGDLGELRERQLLGGLTVTELAERRPPTRPVSAQEAAAQASLFPGDTADSPDDATETAALSGDGTQGTALAVASSRMPRLRPANIAAIVAAAEPTPEVAAVPAAAVAPPPSIPSNADVTRAATERNAIRLRDVNLIGVTGSASDRRAIVRLPSGRFVRVGVGDRLDGGTVAAIGEDTLQYVRRGQNITLDIPG